MQLKKIVKHTNGVRHQINIKKNLLSKYNNIIKRLSIKTNSFSGRNNTGRITVRHKGSGCKSKKHKLKYPIRYYAIVLNVMYNSASNSFVSLNFDLKRKKFFKSICIKNIYTGSLIESNANLTNLKLGCRAFLKVLPAGSIVNSVSSSNKKSIYAKSAGAYCQIIEKRENCVKIKLPSGELISVHNRNFASLGFVDNSIFKLTSTGKAGRSRLRGIRPSVRGIAMNPVDHPHGGKSNKGMPPVTPWGIPTKNKPTVKKP